MKKMPPILQNRAALFDWMVFIISFSLGFIFPTLGVFFTSPEFTWWMLVVMIFYILGSWLKHLPLSYRLSLSPGREIPWVIFLLCGHFVLCLFMVFFAEPSIAKILHYPSIMGSNHTGEGWFVLFTMFMSIYMTWLVYRPKRLKKKQENSI